MRAKEEMLKDLNWHAQKLDPQHYELACVAMIETEVQIDIRDILQDLLKNIGTNLFDHAKES